MRRKFWLEILKEGDFLEELDEDGRAVKMHLKERGCEGVTGPV
jgi:hypothetical protein